MQLTLLKGFPKYAKEHCPNNECDTRFYGNISLSFKLNKVRLSKLKKILLSTLFLTLPFNSSAIFASELLNSNKNSILIAEAKGYREHEDESENEDDYHSINHDWENHYHTIRSIRFKENGNLKIRFCEKVELLEGQVYADDIKYDVKDAYKIKKEAFHGVLIKKELLKRR